MNHENDSKVLIDRIIKVIEELDDINQAYASWDEWDTTKIIDASVNILKEEFHEELIKRYLEDE